MSYRPRGRFQHPEEHKQLIGNPSETHTIDDNKAWKLSAKKPMENGAPLSSRSTMTRDISR